MRILVSVPSVSFASAAENPVLDEHFDDVVRFKSTGETLDVFADELKYISPIGLMCINVPHWDLKSRRAIGVSGPGTENGDLFIPESLEHILVQKTGSYDKWRPYPATPPLSSYNVNIARRFARKRCRMLRKAATEVRCNVLFHVEHSPMSIAHLNEKESVLVANEVIKAAVSVWHDISFADLVIFSPYGIGKQDGFVVSNRLDAKKLSEWEDVRRYLKGT